MSRPSASPQPSAACWPGSTRAELRTFLDAQFGVGFWRIRHNGEIWVYGHQDGARYNRWWFWGMQQDYVRIER
jgi:hypothetical protein